MKPIIFCSLTLFTSLNATAQFYTKMSVERSQSVGDKFEIYISLPKSFDSSSSYNVVYYCDANLKSGRKIQEMLSTTKYDNKLKTTIFVGIGHIGNYHVLRRRDFILPTIKGTDTAGQSMNYGQTDKFYNYLKNELIPSINSRFKVNKDRNTILGHSLGGLFAFYCLFKSENLFSKYFALSPALWIDNYSIYKFNRIQKELPAENYLYFVSGSGETMNHILKGTNEMKTYLDNKKYGNLTYDYEVVEDKTHNSQVPVSLEKIFNEKL